MKRGCSRPSVAVHVEMSFFLVSNDKKTGFKDGTTFMVKLVSTIDHRERWERTPLPLTQDRCTASGHLGHDLPIFK